jgi:membrane glycosyltransferase
VVFYPVNGYQILSKLRCDKFLTELICQIYSTQKILLWPKYLGILTLLKSGMRKFGGDAVSRIGRAWLGGVVCPGSGLCLPAAG